MRSVEMRGFQNQPVHIEVSYKDMFAAIELLVLKSIDLRHGEWIENGEIYEENHTSHSCSECVGQATDRQKEVYEALGIIKHTLKVEDVL